MSEAARSRRPDLRVEPQMDRATAAAGDPLAELARLVGQDDPFRDVFKRGAPRTTGRTEPQLQTESPARPDGRSVQHTGMRGSFEEVDAHQDPGVHADAYDGADPHWDHADQPPEYDTHGDEPHDEYYDEQGHHDPAAETSQHDYHSPPLTPDLWAQHAEPDEAADYPHTPLADETAPTGRAPRRPLAVLAAVLLLTGGGLAATFVARTGTGAAVLGRETPTIMAAAGPNKIKQDDTTASTTPEDADTALLNRNHPPTTGPTRVVNSEEQPVDLSQLPKVAGSGDAQGDLQPSAPTGSLFPEPKKVKTFVVRPDGTIVSSGSAPPAPNADLQGLPAMASLPPVAEASAPPPRPTTPTPKASARAATTPRSAPTSIADAAGGTDPTDTAPAPRAKQPASAGAKASHAKPVEVADASASITPASTGQGGAYGLQLAAAPSEQEARDLFGKLQKKYSAELGAYRPTIRKADSGDKSVYRLRVGNLSQDQAKQICSQLQASGGSCFVVRN